MTGKIARSGVEAARRKFTPEFMNRLDKIVTFQPLGTEQLKKILDIELNLVQQRIFNTSAERAFVFTLSDASKDFLLERGHGPEVRRAAPEARHRAAAGPADVEPDRYRSGARRRLDPRRLTIAAAMCCASPAKPKACRLQDMARLVDTSVTHSGDDLRQRRDRRTGAHPDRTQFEDEAKTQLDNTKRPGS